MEIAHAEVKSNAKRRKLDAGAGGDLVKSSSLDIHNSNQCSCLINSTRISLSSDQTPANLICRHELCDNSSRSAHLQVENLKANNSTFMNSRELTPSSLSDVMETTTKKKKTKSTASSAQQPSMAEIEEFFSVAEKYEAKRFADKYNYDIVKDVALQGKYQWVRIKH